MTTKSLSVGTSERAERSGRRGTRAPEGAATMSERARTANREWYPGLCTTCVNEPVCTFPRSVDRPVVNCDEFQGAVEVAVPHVQERPRLTQRFVVANREWFPGLCMTCEHRDACTFPKPEGGVFSCDEFE